jgi:hypothetical protein
LIEVKFQAEIIQPGVENRKYLRFREEIPPLGNNIAKKTLFKQICATSSTPFGHFERIKGCEFDDNCKNDNA